MKYLTVAQVAERLGRNVELVRRWIREGRLRAQKIGPIWVVTVENLRKFRKDEPERRERAQ